jgi:hypothetical protein
MSKYLLLIILLTNWYSCANQVEEKGYCIPKYYDYKTSVTLSLPCECKVDSVEVFNSPNGQYLRVSISDSLFCSVLGKVDTSLIPQEDICSIIFYNAGGSEAIHIDSNKNVYYKKPVGISLYRQNTDNEFTVKTYALSFDSTPRNVLLDTAFTAVSNGIYTNDMESILSSLASIINKDNSILALHKNSFFQFSNEQILKTKVEGVKKPKSNVDILASNYTKMKHHRKP